MRSIPYSDIEKGVAAIAGIDPTSLLAHEKVLLAEYISDATKFCWDYYPWSEFTKTEKRYFRDAFVPSADYKAGDEVYYEGKYYRARVDNSDAVIDISTVNWYEVGDTIGAPEWSKTELYYRGAKVQYEGNLYICIDQPMSNIPAHGEDPCSFDINGISITDTDYFEEIYNVFDRYIAYEQENKDAIGTCLAITLEDPRYNDTKPLNWREDREGIYIYPNDLTFNEVWIRYRLQAPIFTKDSANEDVPKFLAQAIKTFAYKHWLIGDGQHEKALQQDLYGMDLLVRELDKLDSQQERGQPYTIIKNPYRRLNAKQKSVTPITEDQIGSLVEGTAEVSITVNTLASGYNAVKRGYSTIGTEVFADCRGRNAVVYGSAQILTEVTVSARGRNAVTYGYPTANIQYSLQARGYNIVKQGTAIASASYGVSARGYKLSIVIWSGWDFPPPIIIVECEDVVGRNYVKQGQAVLGIDTTVSCEGKNVIVEGNASLSCAISTTVTGRNAVVESTASSDLSINVIASGKNCVIRSNASIGLSVGTTFQGRNVVVRGQALPMAIELQSVSNGRNAVVYGNSSPMALEVESVGNGRNAVVYGNAQGLINTVVTASVTGYNSVILGFANVSTSVSIIANGRNAVVEGSANSEISVGLENIERRRVKSGSAVDMGIEIFLGQPKEVQIFNSRFLNRKTYTKGEATQKVEFGLDHDDIFMAVGSQYYAPVVDFYASENFTPVLIDDLPKFNFGSYGSGYTFEYLFKDPDVMSSSAINYVESYPIQEETILIRKAPIYLTKQSQDINAPLVEAYIVGLPHAQTRISDGAYVGGDDVVIGYEDQDPVTVNPRTEGYTISFRWAVVAAFDGYHNHPENGTLRTASTRGFLYQFINNTGGRWISTITEYEFGRYTHMYENNYDGWDDPATSTNRYHGLRNTFWNRTNSHNYYRRFINDGVVIDGYAPDNAYAFEMLMDRFDTNRYETINASNHTCEYQAYAYGFHKDSDILYHNMYDPADPWDLSVAWDGENRSYYSNLSPTSIENKKILFRVVPKKLKDRFPLEFSDFVSDEEYLGAPAGIEGVKEETNPVFANAYSAELDGVDNIITIPRFSLDMQGNIPDEPFTFSLWVRPTNISSDPDTERVVFLYTARQVNSYQYPSYGEFTIGLSNNRVFVKNNPAIGSESPTNYPIHYVSTPDDGQTYIQNNAWHHILVVRYGLGNTDSKIYLNGAVVAEGNFEGSGNLFGSETDDTKLGSSGDSSTAFAGQIDEFAFWKTALPASEIAQVYNNGTPSDLTLLYPKGWWRMGDAESGTGTVITDSARSGYDATLLNNTNFSTQTP